MVRRNRSRSAPDVWPIVADFFVTILAVVVLVEATAWRPAPELRTKLDEIDDQLKPLVASTTVKQANVEGYREARIVLSDQYLGFQGCSWRLTEDRAVEVRRILEKFEPVGEFVASLSIEGHADKRPPTGCAGLTFQTNFELSTKRALSVYAAILGVGIGNLDGATPSSASRFIGSLREHHKVVVAGYGDTRPWPGLEEDPLNVAHRRVEIRFVFCRRTTDPECQS